MITIKPILNVGGIKNGKLTIFDSYDFVINHVDDPHLMDNCNEFLSLYPEHRKANYAVLKLYIGDIGDKSLVEHSGFILAYFKKIKLKNKGYCWVLS